MTKHVIAIAHKHEDGTLTQQVWMVPESLAEFIAFTLGRPHFDSMATGDAAAIIRNAMAGTGGITVVDNRQG